MYLNRWVLLISFIVGSVGVVALGKAFVEYREAVRSYTQVDFTHVPESVIWDDAGTTVSLLVKVTNRSPATINVDYLDLHLYADGAFAGSDYDNWEPIMIASGANEQREVTLEISASDLRDHIVDDDIALSVRGEARVRFDGVQRPMTVRIRIPVLMQR